MREEPTFGRDGLKEIDLEAPPRRRRRPGPGDSAIDWRLVWSIVLALVIVRVLDALATALLAALAMRSLGRALGV